MSLDNERVEYVAELARLQLDPSEIPETAKKINDVLTLIDQMQALDTTGIEPLTNPLDRAQQLRADAVTETNRRERLQANGPATQNGLFLVPKVID